jgi:hypothetical protein
MDDLYLDPQTGSLAWVCYDSDGRVDGKRLSHLRQPTIAERLGGWLHR